MVNTLKRTAFCLAVLSLCCVTLLAQDVAGSRPKSIHVTPSTHSIPTAKLPAALKPIFSNFGPTGNTYFAGDGWLVEGVNNDSGSDTSQWIALPFTPRADSTVQQIQVAVGNLDSQAEPWILSLNSDDGGVVGTALEQITIKNTPAFGTCCAVVSWKLATAQPVTGGTQYWIVASTNDSGSTSKFFGAWAFTPLDDFNYNVDDGGWFSGLSFNGIPAAKVAGSIP